MPVPALTPPPAPPPAAVTASPAAGVGSPGEPVGASGSQDAARTGGGRTKTGDSRSDDQVSPGVDWSVEPLQGWHLPLLDDPAFLALQPFLQRSLLLAVPDRLWKLLARRQPLSSRVLVALRAHGRQQQALGLAASRRLNRSGSCWQLEHLRLASTAFEAAGAPGRPLIAAALLREALQRAPGATSWIASAPSLDIERLACLRELGFQPQRTDLLWLWQASGETPAAPLPGDLQWRGLNRRTAPLLWRLEQACTPAPLRQLLDRRIEDLLDHSRGQGLMLVDPSRGEAVAAARWLADHPDGGMEVELSLHPGWSQLLGPLTEQLLRRLASGAVLWLRSEVGDGQRRAWLEQLGAVPQGEIVLMARSVWRRQQGQPARRTSRRLEAVLEQLQPRRRPLPTPCQPVGHR